jgi:hypothetical protein
VRLIELAGPNRHVAADDDRTPAGLDDDHLQCVARIAPKVPAREPSRALALACEPLRTPLYA